MGKKTTDNEILIRLEPSLPRRSFGIGLFLALGGLMTWLGFSTAPATGYVVFLVGGGALSIWFASRLWQIGAVSLELTELELRETDGRLVARVRDVAAVERGAFAFKPSNGFLISLNSPMDRAYIPGVWWRFGRRIGVGGMTNPAQAKAMADILAAMIKD